MSLETPSPSELAVSAEVPAEVAAMETWVPVVQGDFGVPGMGVAIVRDGKVIWTKMWGIADAETAEPIEQHTLFNVGSISKSITAWGLMALVEDGQIALGDPVAHSLRRWTLTGGDDFGQPTFAQLLSHTGGIGKP